MKKINLPGPGTCISCNQNIADMSQAIEWTDNRLPEGQYLKDDYTIHISCFNHKHYKGLHQNLVPGRFD